MAKHKSDEGVWTPLFSLLLKMRHGYCIIAEMCSEPRRPWRWGAEMMELLSSLWRHCVKVFLSQVFLSQVHSLNTQQKAFLTSRNPLESPLRCHLIHWHPLSWRLLHKEMVLIVPYASRTTQNDLCVSHLALPRFQAHPHSCCESYSTV